MSFPVRTIRRNGATVYIGGDQSGSDPYLIATDAGDGSILPWDAGLSTAPLSGTAVGDIEFNGDFMTVGGYFLTDSAEPLSLVTRSLVRYEDQ